jgi:HEAT repeats
MSVFQPSTPGERANAGQRLDPGQQPTPDYGALGPGADVAGFGTRPNLAAPGKISPESLRLAAFVIGIAAALLAGAIRTVSSARFDLQSLLASNQKRRASANDMPQLDRMKPQKQAETLLELAVRNTAGANEQISARANRWPGKVQWNPQIQTLTAAALNSNDMQVRGSGIEVELAAYGLAKNSASFDYLVKTSGSADHRQKIWALWALGLMGNRGVEPERAVQVLSMHLKDPDVESRQWALEGLALTGSDETIDPLLKAMHDDPASIVREGAACGLAEAGMFTPQQRMTAVPKLLNYSDDPALDAQTHRWAFQALNDITHQHLPNDSAAWRTWYTQPVATGQ